MEQECVVLGVHRDRGEVAAGRRLSLRLDRGPPLAVPSPELDPSGVGRVLGVAVDQQHPARGSVTSSCQAPSTGASADPAAGLSASSPCRRSSRSRPARAPPARRRCRGSRLGPFEEQRLRPPGRPDPTGQVDPLLAVPAGDQSVDRQHVLVEQLRGRGPHGTPRAAAPAGVRRWAARSARRADGSAGRRRPRRRGRRGTPCRPQLVGRAGQRLGDARAELVLEHRQHPLRTRARVYAGSALCGSSQNSIPSTRQAVTVSSRETSSSGRR